MGLTEGFDPPHGRWRFMDERRDEEREFRSRTLARIDAFWSVFSQRAADLEALFERQQDWDLPAFMAEQLGAVHPELMWEFGPAVRGAGHRLVITPESARHLRPLLATLLERAPQLAGWEFYGYRLSEDAEMSEQTVQARTNGTLANVKVRLEPGETGQVNLTFLSPSATRDPEQALKDSFVATETLLGEELLDQWVGEIRAEPLPARKRAILRWFSGSKSEPGLLELAELKPAVDQAVARYREGLRPEPFHVWTRDVSWTLLELKPTQAEDYRAQEDLFVAKTPYLELWRAARDGSAFHDERFSRVGESFCYVKLDGARGLDEEKFADKGEIEDAIDEALAPAGLGCQIGGGTGLRYSYIDLALTDRERGLQAVCERLRAGNVPRRSWVQFFGREQCREWFGIYSDSPPPPLLV
jgi:hypothetical protein